MDVVWFFVAFSTGVLAGFFVFAMFQVSRGSDTKQRVLGDAEMLSFELDGDAPSHM